MRTLLNTGKTKRCANRLPGIEEIDFSDLGPPREPRDEATLLLTVGAEIEHALMAQYLYAAYSVRQDQTNHECRGNVAGIAARLIHIAREEMGHFITVQNLLHLIGAPHHFDRQDSPFESALYPFRFKLERLSQGSLAKYVTAESPVIKPPDMDDEVWCQLCAIALEAKSANDGQRVRHVGRLYARLIQLFSDTENGLKGSAFATCPDGRQAEYADWGYDPGTSVPNEKATRKVQVDSFVDQDPAKQRRKAVDALRQLSEQGEGFGAGVESHFERFLKLYCDFKELTSEGVDFVWPVATNPTVLPTQVPDDWSTCNVATAARLASAARGYIAAPRSRDWALLLNIRYRLLLAFLAYFLRRSDELYVEEAGGTVGDPTERGLLLIWTFDEMRRVKKIAEKLVHLPLREPDDGLRAGAPFQLPYTLSVAETERHRWRSHLDVVRWAIRLVADMRKGGGPIDRDDPFLIHLQAADIVREKMLVALAAGSRIPADQLPKDFSKVVHILEQAVRGFTINVHGNFWSGLTRKEFVERHIFNKPLFERESEKDCRMSANKSYLVSITRSRMPAYRPKIHPLRHQFISDWVDQQAPDNDPRGQPGIHSEPRPSPEPTPAAVLARAPAAAPAAPSYAADIQPLFRDFDREFLKRLDRVDIDDIESVRIRAKYLAERLKEGLLPYDINWPQDYVDRFQQWIDGGKNA